MKQAKIVLVVVCISGMLGSVVAFRSFRRTENLLAF